MNLKFKFWFSSIKKRLHAIFFVSISLFVFASQGLIVVQPSGSLQSLSSHQLLETCAMCSPAWCTKISFESLSDWQRSRWPWWFRRNFRSCNRRECWALCFSHFRLARQRPTAHSIEIRHWFLSEFLSHLQKQKSRQKSSKKMLANCFTLFAPESAQPDLVAKTFKTDVHRRNATHKLISNAALTDAVHPTN